MKKFTENKILVASGNKGKIREIKELLQPFKIEIFSAQDFDIPEPEETGLTFIENAEIKAKYYGDITGIPALSDDSGLCVAALNGQPGIYSARWAGMEKDFTKAALQIEHEIGSNPNKKAHFVCALSLYWPEEKHFETVEGTVHGTLTFPPRGMLGFGYDPIFIADGYTQTFGEIDPEEKHSISHRADAFKKLLKACF